MMENSLPTVPLTAFDLDPTYNPKLRADLWERLICSIEKQK
jgi:hypothetical protein